MEDVLRPAVVGEDHDLARDVDLDVASQPRAL